MKSYISLIGFLVILMSVLITLNIFFQQSLQMEMAEQFNKQQLLLSKSISDHISAYLFFLKQDAILAANMLGRRGNIDKRISYDILREFIKKREIIKINFGVIDSNGTLLFYDGNKDEAALLIKDLLKKVKEMEPSNSKIIETSKTIIIFLLVFHLDKILGAVFFNIDIENIAKHFVGNIKSGNRGYAWIIDKKGTLLYHPTQPAMIGGNIYKTEDRCFKCHINFDLEKRIIEGKTSNYGRHIAPSGEDKIVAFSDLNIDDLSWIIAASAPYSEVTLATKRSMNIYSYLVISLFAAASIVSVILIVLNKKRIKAEEAAKRKKEVERYALQLEERVKERTAELANEKEKLNTIVSAIGGGIVVIDRNAKIIWANEAIKNMFNMDVVGKYCEELWVDCDISSSHVKDGIETIVLSSFWGQRDKFFQITTAPMQGEDGEIHGYIRLIQDITEIKKMEEQIIHSEKLASIGRLASGIAHEIGNPLTSIFSFVQILREIEDDPFKKESLDTIYFHINRISEILKQLSGFSKMPTGEMKESNINEIVETTINLIQYDKRAKNINIVKELSPSLPSIMIDSNRLSQVFVNLTLNAIDAMPDGGTLTIKTIQDKNEIVIVFQDTGIGIPKADLSKIFDPFFTTKEKGTGLGLAVSYDIVKKMNGTLTVDSEVGKGTTFTIRLPLNN